MAKITSRTKNIPVVLKPVPPKSHRNLVYIVNDKYTKALFDFQRQNTFKTNAGFRFSSFWHNTFTFSLPACATVLIYSLIYTLIYNLISGSLHLPLNETFNL